MFDNLVGQPARKSICSDISLNNFPNSVLYSGSKSSGKLTAALETARVLSCQKIPEGKWDCTCESCKKHKSLVCTDLLILGPRDCYLEIAASQKAFINAFNQKAQYLTSARYLFIRSVRKLTMRFSPVITKSDEKISKAFQTLEKLTELLEILDFPRELPSSEELLKITEEIKNLCAKIESDFFYDSIPINQIRNMEEWARIKSEKGKKTVIIENAEKMQTGVRNALLKILEEPPQDCVFILTTSKKSAVMPTILSRVRTYNFLERNSQTQLDVIKRVFHNDDFNGTIDDYLLTFLPVLPSTIKEQALIFIRCAAFGKPCDIENIVKICKKFDPRVEFTIFLDSIYSLLKKTFNFAQGCEFSYECMKLLRECYDNVTLFNQNPCAALEKLFRDIVKVNSTNGGILKCAVM